MAKNPGAARSSTPAAERIASSRTSGQNPPTCPNWGRPVDQSRCSACRHPGGSRVTGTRYLQPSLLRKRDNIGVQPQLHGVGSPSVEHSSVDH